MRRSRWPAPYHQPAGAQLRAAVEPDYDAFLTQRAEMIHSFMSEACEGNQPHLREVLASTQPRTQ